MVSFFFWMFCLHDAAFIRACKRKALVRTCLQEQWILRQLNKTYRDYIVGFFWEISVIHDFLYERNTLPLINGCFSLLSFFSTIYLSIRLLNLEKPIKKKKAVFHILLWSSVFHSARRSHPMINDSDLYNGTSIFHSLIDVIYRSIISHNKDRSRNVA